MQRCEREGGCPAACPVPPGGFPGPASRGCILLSDTGDSLGVSLSAALGAQLTWGAPSAGLSIARWGARSQQPLCATLVPRLQTHADFSFQSGRHAL